jgi:hypothetical protein
MKLSISEAQKGKYFLILHEFSTPLEYALAIKKNLDLLVSFGLERLDFGMQQWAEVDKFPSFVYDDPYDPYDLKDFYFLATNTIFVRDPKNLLCPWNTLPSSLGEIYFESMLKRIKGYENWFKSRYNSEYHFNKGMVYANLGVMQASQRKIDEGFANILKALDEDGGYSTRQARKRAFFRRDLFTQFEDDYVKKQLSSIVVKLGIQNESEAPKYVDKFLKYLKVDQRTFFDYDFARIMQNLEIWHEKENRFTSNRLLAYSQDLCLFAEDLLRKKRVKGGDLGDLIKNGFGIRNQRNCGAKSLKELGKNLRNHFKEKDAKTKCLKILLTLRNFSSHNISGGTKNNYFYKNFEITLMEIFRAIFEIYKLKRKLCTTP